MKRRVLAMTMAAVTALTSTSICAFADGQDSEALAAAITVAKTRLDIPEELTQFTYNTVNSNLTDTYTLTWSTPIDSAEYKSVSVNVCGSLITQYYNSDDGWWWNEQSLAKLTGDELYSKAKALIKKINPTVAGVIDIDRNSLEISLYSDRASFDFVRTRNGVPVQNDRGSIVLNKNTGELISFNMNWHEKATFKSAKDALSVDKAKEKYAQMIDIQPQYEIYYDWENGGELKTRLVYVQSDYGEINAFTGKKSDFSADGYYDEDMNDCITEEECGEADKGNPETGGGYEFTEQEQAELDKRLPYAGEQAVRELLQNDPYLTYKTDMELSYSDLYKVTFGDKTSYYYTARFTNENWGYEFEEPEPVVYDYSGEIFEEDVAVEDVDRSYQTVRITVDAESGQILNYSYYDTGVESSTSYDMAKADKLAEDIAKKYAGDMFGEYKDYNSRNNSWKNGQTTYYSGSNHTWTRYVNDIRVSGNSIDISFNSNMKLSSYSISYSDVEFADPKDMLTAKQVMTKFWKDNALDLYYLARLDNKVTKTVLVYGTDNTVYADAFTGEPVYGYYSKQENDLSGIKDKTIKKMAQALDDHGIIISTEKFSENDPATEAQFSSLLRFYDENEENNGTLTKGTALVLFVKSVCGDVVPELKGIYKSPFSDVKDSDKNVGYYAIAYGLGVVDGDKLEPDSAFSMGDMIKMVYSMYTGEFSM